MKSDLATDNRREDEDKTLNYNRDKNDASTQERRFEADKTMDKNRARNDEMTADRREIKDINRDMVLAISLFLLILVLVGILFVLI